MSIQEFIDQFYAPAPPGIGVIELRWISHDGAHTPTRAFVETPREIELQARAWDTRARKSGVYFGVAMRKPNGSTGKKEDVSCVTALWVDIDVVKNGWDMQRTIGALKAAPLRPSIIINSGNGLHCYWLLKEPLVVSDEGDVVDIETANHFLAARFGGDSACVDITRILRLPYTHNRKGEKALEVSIEVADWQLEYDWDALYSELQDDAIGAQLFDGEWLSKDAIKERTKELRREKSVNGLADRMLRDISDSRETLSYDEIWQHAKYKAAGGAWIGLDEAILRASAVLYARFGGEWSDETIVDEIMGRVRRIKERDAPNERWNWATEKAEIWDKLDRFKGRWQQMKEDENGQTKRGRGKKQRHSNRAGGV